MSRDKSEYTKKIAIDIDNDLDARLKKILPWGIQSEVLRSLLRTFATAAEREGAIIVHQVMSDELTLVTTRSVQIVNASNHTNQNSDGK